MKRAHTKTKRNLYISFIIISTFISASLYILFFSEILPYQLQLIKKEPQNDTDYAFYHDFDKDGYSELIRTNSSVKDGMPYFHLQNYSGGIIDQFNFTEPLNRLRIFFEDYTGDGYDEIFVFTEHSDSLYLYVIDPFKKEYIIRRNFLLKADKNNSSFKGEWKIYNVAFLEKKGENVKDMYFIAVSGCSYSPRGVYRYDINQKKIIQKFESAAYLQHLLIFDLTGDGNEEIILTSGAVGNIPYETPFKDDRCWLFIFDQNLHLKFKPVPFGEYSSRLYGKPIPGGYDEKLILVYSYFGNKNLSNYIYTLDSNLGIVRTLPVQRNIPDKLGLIFDKFSREPTWIFSSPEKNLIKINHRLEQLECKPTETFMYCTGIIDDFIPGYLPEFLCFANEKLFIYNTNLELIASHPIKGLIPGVLISLRYNGVGNAINLGINTSDYFYQFSINAHPLYTIIPAILLLCFVSVFFMQILLFKIFLKIKIFINFLSFSLLKSKNGIIIINEQGKVLYFNQIIQNILNIKSPITKKEHFKSALQERNDITSFIQESMEKSSTVREKLSYSKKDYQFEGEISITPFSSYFDLTYAYLVEILDYTNPIKSERLQIWSKSVQKIAHEIKQPLSSIALNLKALQLRIEDNESSRREDLLDDIDMIKNELNRIRNLTRGFLQFANLEKPKKQLVNVHQIIKQVIDRYKSFTEGNILIQADFENCNPNIYADPQQIESVFNILFENAIDAMQGKGMIQISFSLAQNLEKPDKEFLNIEVADTGPGIDDQIKTKIFEPNFSTKKEGTGLGLAIAKKIIAEHDGEIDVYSKEDFGTVFQFSVPVYNQYD